MQQLWNTTIPQIEIKEHAEICQKANFKVKDTYDFMGAGISIKMQNYKGGVYGKNNIAEPQGMWSSNFFQTGHAQHFFYL